MNQPTKPRRLQLWLKKSDDRPNEPEWFVKDVKDLDDPYQAIFFKHRTISENDKFITGTFTPDNPPGDAE